MYTYYYY